VLKCDALLLRVALRLNFAQRCGSRARCLFAAKKYACWHGALDTVLVGYGLPEAKFEINAASAAGRTSNDFVYLLLHFLSGLCSAH
jgi:hypothetical protein